MRVCAKVLSEVCADASMLPERSWHAWAARQVCPTRPPGHPEGTPRGASDALGRAPCVARAAIPCTPGPCVHATHGFEHCRQQPKRCGECSARVSGAGGGRGRGVGRGWRGWEPSQASVRPLVGRLAEQSSGARVPAAYRALVRSRSVSVGGGDVRV